MLDVTPIRAFDDNYIWLIRSPVEPRRCAVVDPGDAAPVFEALEAHGLALNSILVTHHHPDHVGGVQSLHDATGAFVVGPAAERIPAVARKVRGGDRVSLAELGLTFDVLDLPGHTLGHVAYVGHGALFCGDTLFASGCGRLFEGTPAQMLDSLDRLSHLPDATKVYPAHEYTAANLRFATAVEPTNPAIAARAEAVTAIRSQNQPSLPTTIGAEREVNPFLRSRIPAVRAAAESQAGRELPTAVDVFAAVRRWKDGYR